MARLFKHMEFKQHSHKVKSQKYQYGRKSWQECDKCNNTSSAVLVWF